MKVAMNDLIFRTTRPVLAIFLSAILYVPILYVWTQRTEADERPNFLFILTDDQAPHTLGVYGNQVCQTPNIDRIAQEGMLIHDAHHMGSWSGAVCRPSRTMIMTGSSVWRIPGAPSEKVDKKTRQKILDEMAQYTMPALFNKAGYDTFRTCKKGNSYNQANQLFQVLHESTMRQASDEKGNPWHGDRAIDFLEKRQADQDEDPFLMFVGFSHPHDPRNGTPELLEKYGAINTKKPPTEINDAAPPLQINYLPEHPFHHGHPGLRDEYKVSGVMEDRSEATIRNELGREYACIEHIDIQIGRILKKLEEMNELENTYIVFTSDHGIAVGRHGLAGKQNLYEHTWRVPLLVRGPGIKVGSDASGFVYLMDVLPTFCELAGIELPKSVEGKSFVSVLEGQKERIRDLVYGVYSGGTKPGMRSVKTSEGWKLIKYDVLNGKVRETQLFNLNENPDELLIEHHSAKVVELIGSKPEPHQVNLAEDPRYTDKRQELEALLLAEQKRLDDPYQLWDQK